MKIYQIVQKNFEILGISPNKSYWNKKSAKSFFIFNLVLISSILFLVLKANTFLEYTMNIYITTVVFAMWIGFIAMLFQKENIFQMMIRFEEFLNKSEYREINILFVVWLKWN